MKNYINTVNEFGRIYRVLLKILEQTCKENNLPPIELLTLADIKNNTNITVKDLAEKGAYSTRHLLFNINNLSRRNLIKTEEKSDNDFAMMITDEAEKVLSEQNIKLSPKLEKSIQQLLKTIDQVKGNIN